MASGPLVLTHRCRVLALDPATGSLLWDIELGRSARRLFRVGGVLLATYDNVVCFIDLASGRLLGHLDLGFETRAGFVKDGRIFLAGDGAACVTPAGQILWRVTSVDHSGIVTSEENLTCFAADGTEQWRSGPLGMQQVSDNTGLLLDELVAQPDMKGRGA